jgi:DNA-binding response OmpR family regulator
VHTHVVILDRDPTIVGVLRFILEDAGYRVSATSNGAEATGLIHTDEPELVLLDPDIKPVDGFRLLAEWRAAGYAGGCIIVSARAALDDQVRAFELGVDDYVIKPFEPVILIARIKSVLRRLRVSARAEASAVISVGDLSLALGTLTVARAGASSVSLTPTEVRVLEYLMRHAGGAVSRQALELHVWGDRYYGDGNRCEVYVRRLRQKIEPDQAQPRYLRTLRAYGYMFVGEDELVDAGTVRQFMG